MAKLFSLPVEAPQAPVEEKKESAPSAPRNDNNYKDYTNAITNLTRYSVEPSEVNLKVSPEMVQKFAKLLELLRNI